MKLRTCSASSAAPMPYSISMKPISLRPAATSRIACMLTRSPSPSEILPRSVVRSSTASV